MDDEDAPEKGEVKIVGSEDGKEKKPGSGGKVSNTYPPIFRAKPQESYAEWKRSVEFWIGGEGSQLPPELVGPRMMVQFWDRAAQLVKHLGNEHVNGADGRQVIFRELEKSPLIRQLDKHRVDQHRRLLMTLSRAAGESMESYVTRASIYRTHLLGLDRSMAMGEAFYTGHLLDHARLTRRDKAMVKTKAGSEVDEAAVTRALIELAPELEGESGYPVGASEPNIARNGEEWLVQRVEGRIRTSASSAASSRLLKGVFMADAEGAEDMSEASHEDGEESVDEADYRPELVHAENEAFGMQYKAKQKIAEVRKLMRQYYRRPDNDAKERALAEQMKTNPCHTCGQLGHWSRECPNKGQAQPVLAARSRPLPPICEEAGVDEWALLMSAYQNPEGNRPCDSDSTAFRGYMCAVPQVSKGFKGETEVNHILWSVHVAASDVLWSIPQLAYKIIMDIGCMRSVVGTRWINMLLGRWRNEGRWFRVCPEREPFKFGDGAVMYSRYRVDFAGSFAGKPVVYGFSVISGNCPPLFSRPGCSQIGAVIDCESHTLGSKKLGIRNYGLSCESGHYTMNIDEFEPAEVCLPDDYQLPSTLDIAPVHASALRDHMTAHTICASPPSSITAASHGHVLATESSHMQDLPGPPPDQGVPPGGHGRCGGGKRGVHPGEHGAGCWRGPGGASEEDSACPNNPYYNGPAQTTDLPESILGVDGGVLGNGASLGDVQRPDRGGATVVAEEARTPGGCSGTHAGEEGLDGRFGGVPEPVPQMVAGAGLQYPGEHASPLPDVPLEEDVLAVADQEGRGNGVRGHGPLEAQSSLVDDALCPRSVGPVGASRGPAAADECQGCLEPGLIPALRLAPLQRGLVQKLKQGVRQALATMGLLGRAADADDRWVLLEIFAGTARLTAVARARRRWHALAPVDLHFGWDLSRPADRKELLDLVDKLEPDLVTMAPPCGPWSSWTHMCRDLDGLWERRRQQLPFWNLVSVIWAKQTKAARLALVEQPERSEALHLDCMKKRRSLFRAVVPQCFFGLCDPATGMPYQKRTALDVNSSVMAAALLQGVGCFHGPGERQHIDCATYQDGKVVRRSTTAAAWPQALCERILDAAEAHFKAQTAPSRHLALHAASSDAWEAVPVSNADIPEEHLRHTMAKQDFTGERYDYVTFEGQGQQQPRRLRAMVAHLHVALGHLSNERLARMLMLSGAQSGVVDLARELRCRVCGMVRPPQAVPQMAYRKPSQFNERISGDSFFVWNHKQKKFGVTHYVDGLTDFQVADATVNPDSTFAKQVLQDQWLAVFGPPDLLITDGGPEFAGSTQALLELLGVFHEVVPEGAKWRLGQAERHGAILKLMIMRMVKALGLSGLDDMRQAVLAATTTKNRICNRAGVSPMQAVTGRNSLLPASMMQQLTSGHAKFKFNEEPTHNEALARGERVRTAAAEAFHWLDASDALRKALAARSRPPHLEGIREGAAVYVFEPPPNRRGLARRLQDHSSWSGPGVVVAVERDQGSPQRVWVRLRGRLKGCALERIRLATVDEQVSGTFIKEALEDVQEQLEGGKVMTDAPAPLPASTNKGDDGLDVDEVEGQPKDVEEYPEDVKMKEQRKRQRAQLLDDVPMSIHKAFEDRSRREAMENLEPHQLDFERKREVFEKLAKTLGPPTTLQEAQLRSRAEKAYEQMRPVRKMIRSRSRPTGGARGSDGTGVVSQALAVSEMIMEENVPVLPCHLKPGELDVLVRDTVGHQVLWSGSSPHGKPDRLEEVRVKLERAENEGITEVVTGRARLEYKWKNLDPQWQAAFTEPLKKAIDFYLEHSGIVGVPEGTVVDPTRILGSRFVLTNRGGANLEEAELKARWVFGGHRDPDAGLYPTSSPTASMLGHNLVNFVAVQQRWTIHYEDVSAAFLQGKELPRTEKIYVKVPHGYPSVILEHLRQGLGGNVRADVVQLTKAGFGLPESARLWYLEYRETIRQLGLQELLLLQGVFRAFHADGRLRALASIHVDDTRYAGDETSVEIWSALHERLKFGKLRKATDGWQKFCGRWERQDPQTFEISYSMAEYTKEIPLAKPRSSARATAAATTSSTRTLSSTSPLGSTTRRTRSSVSSTTGSTLALSSTSPVGSEGARSPPETIPVPTTVSHVTEAEGDLWEFLNEKIQSPDEGGLTPDERKVIGSIIGQINWAARQGRYDLAFAASLVQQLAGQNKPESLDWLNRAVRRSREEVDFGVKCLHCPLDEVIIVSVSDAAYGAMPGGGSQGGNLVLLAAPGILNGVAPVCIVEGNSTKIHRVVRCSMSAEISALATAFEHGDFVRAVYAELVDHRFELKDWKLHVTRFQHILATDARTGYDALNSEVVPSDRKIAIDVAVLRQAVAEEASQCFVRWVPGTEMPGDGLTKWAHNKVLLKVMSEGKWSLVDNPEAQNLRRVAAERKAQWRKAQRAKRVGQGGFD